MELLELVGMTATIAASLDIDQLSVPKRGSREVVGATAEVAASNAARKVTL